MSVAPTRSTRARWKAAEREIASRLDGQRNPVTGRARSAGVADIEHPQFGLEIKTREKIPLWLEDAMDQAKACSRTSNKIPMVILHKVGDRFDHAMVIVQLSDLDHLRLQVTP